MAEIITIDKVVPYENNQKKHPDSQLKALAEVVKEVGWRQNVEVNQKGVIVAGHGRFETWKKYAKQMSLPDVWITDDTGKTIFGKHDERPLTPAQEKMWRIADNKLNESKWIKDDVEMDWRDLDEFYKRLTGFDFQAVTEVEGEEEFTAELNESANYILFFFDNDIDWLAASQMFNLKTVKALDSKKGYERKGVGRVVSGKKLLEIINANSGS